jgi:hypothetical protein
MLNGKQAVARDRATPLAVHAPPSRSLPGKVRKLILSLILFPIHSAADADEQIGNIDDYVISIVFWILGSHCSDADFEPTVFSLSQ